MAGINPRFRDHFVSSDCIASFELAVLCSVPIGRGMASDQKICLYHNNVSYEFIPHMGIGSADDNDDKVFLPFLKFIRSTTILPCTPTVSYVVSVVLNNGQDKTISSGQKDFKHDCFTLACNPEYYLPSTRDELVDMGYATDDSHLLVRFQLMMPRKYFEKSGKYESAITQIEALSFDQFEYEELDTEVQAESRFVLEAVDGTRFCIHKNRLSFASAFFKGVFRPGGEYKEKQNGEMKLEDLTGIALRQMLSFVYLGIVSDIIFTDVVVEISKAVNKYLFNDDLKSLCQSNLLQLTNSSEIEADQIIEYLCLAHEVNMNDLKDCCMDWLYSHWNTVRVEDVVKEMNSDECRQIVWELMDYGFQKRDPPPHLNSAK